MILKPQSAIRIRRIFFPGRVVGAPRLEPRTLAHETEIDERRSRAMTQPAAHSARVRPSQLFGHASGATDNQPDTRAGREIERA